LRQTKDNVADLKKERGLKKIRQKPENPGQYPKPKLGIFGVEMIEKKVGYRTVPVWPWALIAPLLKVVPTALLAPRRRGQV
jgi:hypothetical protein